MLKKFQSVFRLVKFSFGKWVFLLSLNFFFLGGNMRISSRLPSERVHLSLRVQFVAVTLVCFLTEKCLQGEVGKLLSSCSIRHVAS